MTDAAITRCNEVYDKHLDEKMLRFVAFLYEDLCGGQEANFRFLDNNWCSRATSNSVHGRSISAVLGRPCSVEKRSRPHSTPVLTSVLPLQHGKLIFLRKFF